MDERAAERMVQQIEPGVGMGAARAPQEEADDDK